MPMRLFIINDQIRRDPAESLKLKAVVAEIPALNHDLSSPGYATEGGSTMRTCDRGGRTTCTSDY